MKDYLESENRKRIDRNFKYHPPTEVKIKKFKDIRDTAKALAHRIHLSCPESNERDEALIRLEEAVMWANASIARHTKE